MDTDFPKLEDIPNTALRDKIRKVFEKHTIPEGDPELLMFDTDAIIDELAIFIQDNQEPTGLTEKMLEDGLQGLVDKGINPV